MAFSRDHNYIDDKNIDIILYSEGNIEAHDLVPKLEFAFTKMNIHTEVIVIDGLTNEDKILSSSYKVNSSKVTYIRNILKDSKAINIENLVNKPVRELIEMKNVGKYCDVDYTLDGDWCIKEKYRVNADRGEICPNDYI